MRLAAVLVIARLSRQAGHRAVTPAAGDLRRGALGVMGLVAVAVGGIAPEYSVLLTGSVVVGVAGGATPAAFLVTGIGMLAFGVAMASLSRHVSSAGGLYGFARKGLGPNAGYLTGWLYLGIAVVVTPATFISSAFLVQNFFTSVAPGQTWLSASWVLWGSDHHPAHPARRLLRNAGLGAVAAHTLRDRRRH